MRTLDFNAYAETVKAYTVRQLLGALEDIRQVLPSADALDRAEPWDRCENRGGFYRDQASVLRAELRSR